ncbi:MAG: LemA family protein [Parcubacteria group bacterium LiPW_41]|nr:MAG: LemA family protein [Parcubacteria group bacterium LiPW_41]
MKKGLLITLGVFGILILIVVSTIGWGVGKYNGFVTLDQAATSQWAQVENVYQRRADLVPNLVSTVKGVAKFEKETFTAVTEARAKVGQVKIDPTNITAEGLKKFQEAQAGLGGALQRLMVVSENYPQLKANENFLQLQAQLEGTENRIAVERKKYNEAAQEFNTAIKKFPGSIIAGMGGFSEKAYFKADEGAKSAPKVEF